jgi:hypothetical protein
MNRQEAAEVLTKLKQSLEISDDDDYCYYSRDIDAYDTAITALRGPQPDPDTGMMPCGCGGRVSIAFYPGWHGVPDMYHVDCFNCHVGTRPCQTAEQAKAAWNTAMGVKTLKQACPYCSWIDPESLEEDEVDGPQNHCRVCGRDLRR